mmetsp:Transcript_55897/g.132638  ORF Transcript_55897/g.132638 Transcript_55897/m.132638 type:complete len:87 (+) Transcript_55897:264-524(+)
MPSAVAASTFVHKDAPRGSWDPAAAAYSAQRFAFQDASWGLQARMDTGDGGGGVGETRMGFPLTVWCPPMWMLVQAHTNSQTPLRS